MVMTANDNFPVVSDPDGLIETLQALMADPPVRAARSGAARRYAERQRQVALMRAERAGRSSAARD